MLDLTRDYSHFIIQFFEVISASAPHIYISALPLSPQTSIVHKLYKQYACPLLRIVQGLPVSWNPVLATTYNKTLRGIAAWSPCNKFIAVANPTSIDILDAVTLEQLNTFKSSDESKCLSFSPDGCTLTQFSSQKFINWDIQTGGPVNTIPIAEGWGMDSKNSSVVYSMDGSMLAFSNLSDRSSSCISTYNLCSGTCMGTYEVKWKPIATIWTHGECIRFISIDMRSITMWEAAFTSVHTPVMIESFSGPTEMITNLNESFLFLPAHSQLAFTAIYMVYIWDLQGSRFLLKYGPISDKYGKHPFGMSLSSNGCFFSCMSIDGEVYVWKRSSNYVLHQKLTFHPEPMCLISPNGESIIVVGSSKIHLWHTRGQTLSISSTTAHEHGREHILEFSPNGEFAASSYFGGDTFTVLDTKSGDPRFIIHTGIKIECLRVTESAVAVVGEGKVITWRLPAEKHITTLNDPEMDTPNRISVSPDLSYVAVSTKWGLGVWDVSTGKWCASTPVSQEQDPLSIALDECRIWCMNVDHHVKGWKIVKNSRSQIRELEPLEPTEYPSQIFPWQSHHGYEVTNDGWVLSPTKKRLMWLPHHWMSEETFRIWSGQILGLRHRELPEVVILEFFE